MESNNATKLFFLFVIAMIGCAENSEKEALKLDIQVQELIIKDRKDRINFEKEAGMADSTYNLRMQNLEKEIVKLDSLKAELRKYQ